MNEESDDLGLSLATLLSKQASGDPEGNGMGKPDVMHPAADPRIGVTCILTEAGDDRRGDRGDSHVGVSSASPRWVFGHLQVLTSSL
jgi:hypothetical protein